MSDLLVVDAVYQLITEFMNITDIKIGLCDRNLILDAEILFKSSILNTSFFILFSESRWNACSSASSYSCRKAIQKWARKRRGRISNRKVSCFFFLHESVILLKSYIRAWNIFIWKWKNIIRLLCLVMWLNYVLEKYEDEDEVQNAYLY